ncbi:MAG: metal ABC transporter permease [Planctomycetes bacterium]|nr:metal ABC transporter permease [Planctomycetota bacterium]
MLEAASIFQYEFAQRALAGGLLFALVAGVLGVFIVQRGLSFVGAGLSHAAFGGVALGLLLGVSPIWAAAPFTLLTALLLVFLQRRTKMKSDVIVGVLFATAMALGAVFLSLKREVSGDVMSYLFGDILAISSIEVWAAAGLAIVVLGAAARYWGRWAYAAFDEELARSQGLRVALDDLVLLLLTALAVVVGMKMVGMVLLAAFLVIPASAARLASRSLAGMTIGAVLIALLSVVGGVVASFVGDLPSGATIVLIQALIFGAFAMIPRKA